MAGNRQPESELESRVLKHTNELQNRVNNLNAQLRKIQGQLTHPAALAKLNKQITQVYNAVFPGGSSSNTTITLTAMLPLGFLVMTDSSTNPGTTLGYGTWTQVDGSPWITIGLTEIYLWKRTA